MKKIKVAKVTMPPEAKSRRLPLLSFALLSLFSWLAIFGIAHGEQVTFSSLVISFSRLINQVVALITGLALLVFIWGVFRYISAGSDRNRITEARNFIIFGIIGLFVMFSVWGLVNLLIQTAGLNSTQPTAPQFQTNP
jgi:L-cystine uptake protein TcyP (sodium:dicarboxylate symporter family)